MRGAEEPPAARALPGRCRGAVRAPVPASAPRPAAVWPGPAAAAPPPPPRVPPGDSPRPSRLTPLPPSCRLPPGEALRRRAGRRRQVTPPAAILGLRAAGRRG